MGEVEAEDGAQIVERKLPRPYSCPNQANYVFFAVVAGPLPIPSVVLRHQKDLAIPVRSLLASRREGLVAILPQGQDRARLLDLLAGVPSAGLAVKKIRQLQEMTLRLAPLLVRTVNDG